MAVENTVIRIGCNEPLIDLFGFFQLAGGEHLIADLGNCIERAARQANELANCYFAVSQLLGYLRWYMDFRRTFSLRHVDCLPLIILVQILLIAAQRDPAAQLQYSRKSVEHTAYRLEQLADSFITESTTAARICYTSARAFSNWGHRIINKVGPSHPTAETVS